MGTILILTKNLMAEQQPQETLQYLDYEVFASVKAFHFLTHTNNLEHPIKNYQAIVLSDTISEFEIVEIVPKLKAENQIILRKNINTPPKRLKQQWKTIGIDGWLSNDNLLEQAREVLSEKLEDLNDFEEDQFLLNTQVRKVCRNTDLEKLNIFLSNKEKLVFKHLREAEAGIVSRTDLCHYLWGDEPNNSYLSQISIIVRNIRRKMVEYGYLDISIETLRGTGYRLVSTDE
ncbi:MAG: winged helix-turn-helix domain-containing protein [Enterococcus avium]